MVKMLLWSTAAWMLSTAGLAADAQGLQPFLVVSEKFNAFDAPVVFPGESKKYFLHLLNNSNLSLNPSLKSTSCSCTKIILPKEVGPDNDSGMAQVEVVWPDFSGKSTIAFEVLGANKDLQNPVKWRGSLTASCEGLFEDEYGNEQWDVQNAAKSTAPYKFLLVPTGRHGDISSITITSAVRPPMSVIKSIRTQLIKNVYETEIDLGAPGFYGAFAEPLIVTCNIPKEPHQYAINKYLAGCGNSQRNDLMSV